MQCRRRSRWLWLHWWLHSHGHCFYCSRLVWCCLWPSFHIQHARRLLPARHRFRRLTWYLHFFLFEWQWRKWPRDHCPSLSTRLLLSKSEFANELELHHGGCWKLCFECKWLIYEHTSNQLEPMRCWHVFFVRCIKLYSMSSWLIRRFSWLDQMHLCIAWLFRFFFIFFDTNALQCWNLL